MKRLLTLVLLILTFGSAAAADRTVYYHTDALGSVVAATDEQGELLWRESYKPFGDRLDRQVSTNDNSAFFTGKPHDDTTGLSYFGARYYDPEIGRFTGIDPAGVDPGNIYSFSCYAYANNNPYGFVDPDGNSPVNPVDWTYFAHDVGKMIMQEIVYAAAKVNGNEAIANMAADDMRESKYDAMISTVGVMNPAPGTAMAARAARAEKNTVKLTDKVSKQSLRRRSLVSGRKKLLKLGLTERVTRTGRREFVDSKGLVRAASLLSHLAARKRPVS